MRVGGPGSIPPPSSPINPNSPSSGVPWQQDLIDANMALYSNPPDIARAEELLKDAGKSVPPPPNNLVDKALRDLNETPPDVAAVKALLKPYMP